MDLNNAGPREVTYAASCNLLSITEPNSHITYVSQEFCDISGYKTEELIGQPHNVIRHPDMPKSAFANMWSHLQNHQSWMGMVKNRCANGDYYWVDAFVSPITKNGKVSEYQSVRTCPKREHVANAEKIYAQLNTGKTPLKLKLPRTRLWQRAAIALMLSTIFAYWLEQFLAISGVPVMFFLAVIIFYTMTRRLEALTVEARSIFDNPMMELIYNNKVDDISEIELALKMRTSETNAISGRMQDSNEQIITAMKSSFQNLGSMSNQLDSQSAEIEQVAAAINQMHSTANEVAKNAQSTAETTDEAKLAAAEGMSEVRSTLNAIDVLVNQLEKTSVSVKELETNTNTIESVLTIIQGVAEQTNLLALNAAIEAARAGEQGRGFAVVADEVRQLAKKSHDSTTEIQSVINLIRNATQTVVEAMSEGEKLSLACIDSAKISSDKLEQLLEEIVEISDQNSHIATAVAEMSNVSEEMNNNVQSISQSTYQLSSSTTALVQDSQVDNGGVMDNLISQSKLAEQFRRTS